MMQILGEWGKRGVAFLLLFVGVLIQRWDLDFDAWFILNGGRYVMEHGIPHEEPFTMHEGLHFVLEQWLTGVLFWNVYDSFGPMGLLQMVFVICCVLIYAYYRLCLLVSNGNRQVATLMAMVVGIVAAPFFFVTRPQVISTLLFVSEVFLLEQYARRNQWRWLLPLPLLSLLLVNLHAALWPMLLILLLPFFASWGVGKLDVLPREYHGKFPVLPFALAALGIFGAGFCNPYGWEAMSFVFYSYDPEIHGRIGEIHPATIQGFFGKFFFGWILLLTIIQGRHAMPLHYILLTFGTALMGLCAQRNAFLFFFLGTFPLAYAAREWKSVLLSGRQGMGSPLRLLPFVILCLLLGHRALVEGTMAGLPPIVLFLFIILALCLVCYVFCYTEEGRRFSFKVPMLRLKCGAILLSLSAFLGFIIYYPNLHGEDFGAQYEPTVDFLLEKQAASDIVLWTGFNTGAYPEFRGIRCYVDARPEIFLPSNSHQEHNIIKEYYDLVDGKIYYRDFFHQYHFTHVLTVEADGVVHAMLPYDDGFRLIYEQKDEAGNVLCRLFEIVREEDGAAGKKF